MTLECKPYFAILIPSIYLHLSSSFSSEVEIHTSPGLCLVVRLYTCDCSTRRRLTAICEVRTVSVLTRYQLTRENQPNR
jgi:hypothetical protein